MKKLIMLICLFLVVASLFNCPPIPPAKGSLVISFAELIGRTIQPDFDMEPEMYFVTGAGPGDDNFTATSDGSDITVQNLTPGIWMLTVEVKNKDKDLILSGEEKAVVKAEETTAVTVIISPLSGNGIMNLTAQWNVNSIESEAGIKSELVPYVGPAVNLDFTIDEINGIATYANDAVPAGYYILIIKLFDGDALKGGIIEVVRIIEGPTTATGYTINTDRPGILDVLIDLKLDDPLEVEIQGLNNGESLTGSALTSASIIDNEDVGNVVYVWWLDSEPWNTGPDYTVTADDALDINNQTKVHELTVTAYTVNGEKCGSAFVRFNVKCTLYYYDGDGDGYGFSEDNTRYLLVPTEPFTGVRLGDCDDTDDAVYPGAPEICDGKDNDCDGEVDEEDAIGCTTYYYDADNDGYGTNNSGCYCSPTGNYRATHPGDCDDSNPSIRGCTTYYYDADNDGYGTNSSGCYCSATGNYRATRSGDCNDSNANVNPGVPERCNGIDDDCNGLIDEENAIGCATYYYDADNDGYGTTNSGCYCSPTGYYRAIRSGDCNDSNSNINPGAAEICDGLNNDCDEWIDEGEVCSPCSSGWDQFEPYYSWSSQDCAASYVVNYDADTASIHASICVGRVTFTMTGGTRYKAVFQIKNDGMQGVGILNALPEKLMVLMNGDLTLYHGGAVTALFMGQGVPPEEVSCSVVSDFTNALINRILTIHVTFLKGDMILFNSSPCFMG